MESDFCSSTEKKIPFQAGETSGRALVFIKGLLSSGDIREAIRKRLTWISEDATAIVETSSLEGIEMPGKLHHISEFGPDVGDPSSREGGRQWVAQLSETVLNSTGKPVWKSFEYKGVSAWWFIEIVFQEPSYLVARRKQALEKAARMLVKGGGHSG